MSVLLVGTLDTKGTEVAFVRDRLIAAGVAVTVLDAGALGEPAFAPDIPRERVYRAAQEQLSEDLAMRVEEQIHAVDAALAEDLPAFNALVRNTDVPAVVVPDGK